MAIYSIGHSTISEQEFLDLAKELDVILDVRSHPTSRWPQFYKEQMQNWLPAAGKKYEWEPALGGWDKRHAPLLEEMKKYDVDLTSYLMGKFPKQTIAKKIQNYPLFEEKPTWTNRGLYDYSFFMMTIEFLAALKELIQRPEKIGIMCCESLYFKCHRSMIADCLWWHGVDTIHLMPTYRQKNCVKYLSGYKKTLHSQVIGNRIERYDQRIIDFWSEAALNMLIMSIL